jgi:hypothetical protein
VEAEDLEQAKRAFQDSTFEIDQEHRQAQLASLEKVEELVPLFHFRSR